MDTIACYLTFESYSYNMSVDEQVNCLNLVFISRYEVRMRWNEPLPVQLFKDIELPDFTMINYSILTVQKVLNNLNCLKLFCCRSTLPECGTSCRSAFSLSGAMVGTSCKATYPPI